MRAPDCPTLLELGCGLVAPGDHTRRENLVRDAPLFCAPLRHSGVIIALAGVLLRQAVDHLNAAFFGCFDHLTAYFQITIRIFRVYRQDGHMRVPLHVPILLTTTRRVDDDVLAVKVAPDRRRLRLAVRHDGYQSYDNWLFQKVPMRVGNLCCHFLSSTMLENRPSQPMWLAKVIAKLNPRGHGLTGD